MSVAAVFVGKRIENAVLAWPHFNGVPGDRFFFLLSQRQRRLQELFNFLLFARSSFQLGPNREFAHGGSSSASDARPDGQVANFDLRMLISSRMRVPHFSRV